MDCEQYTEFSLPLCPSQTLLCVSHTSKGNSWEEQFLMHQGSGTNEGHRYPANTQFTEAESWLVPYTFPVPKWALTPLGWLLLELDSSTETFPEHPSVHTNHTSGIILPEGPEEALVNEAPLVHMFFQCLWHFPVCWAWHDVSVAFSLLMPLWYY